MRDLRRLMVLAGLAIVAFVAALVTFGEDAEAGCVIEAEEDPAYEVRLDDQVVVGRDQYRLSVTRDGALVTGARVCLTASMEDRSAVSVSAEAAGVEPGIYEVTIDFEMTGSWEGTVVVRESERSAVSVPVSFEVG